VTTPPYLGQVPPRQKSQQRTRGRPAMQPPMPFGWRALTMTKTPEKRGDVLFCGGDAASPLKKRPWARVHVQYAADPPRGDAGSPRGGWGYPPPGDPDHLCIVHAAFDSRFFEGGSGIPPPRMETPRGEGGF
jgi:hypothetical protein